MVLARMEPTVPAASTATHTTTHPLDAICVFLAQHLAEQISVADMARSLNISTSRFATLFRKQFGLPPHQYVLALRLQRSQTLLVQSTMPVWQIAECCGFADVHHFSKAFKRMTGVSPKAYRNGRIVRHA